MIQLVKTPLGLSIQSETDLGALVWSYKFEKHGSDGACCPWVVRPVPLVLPCLSPDTCHKAFAQNGDLTPRVPTSRNKDTIAVESVGFVDKREWVCACGWCLCTGGWCWWCEQQM